jgi:hypothetical protein
MVKYIPLKNLEKHIKDIILEVYKEQVEYIIMDKKTPLAKISPLPKKTGDEVFMEEETEEKVVEKFLK